MIKIASRPQYHRLRRILEMIREGTRTGSLPNCRHFARELGVARRTIQRDLDFLRDDERAPIAYDDSRKGYHLTDPTFILPPVQLTRREVFSFSIARKLLERFAGTPLEMDTVHPATAGRSAPACANHLACARRRASSRISSGARTFPFSTPRCWLCWRRCRS